MLSLDGLFQDSALVPLPINPRFSLRHAPLEKDSNNVFLFETVRRPCIRQN